jgi:hypothetical protein
VIKVLSSPIGGSLVAAVAAICGVGSIAWMSTAADGRTSDVAVVFPLATGRDEAFARVTQAGGSPLREGGAAHVVVAHFPAPPDSGARRAMGALAFLDPRDTAICGQPVSPTGTEPPIHE